MTDRRSTVGKARGGGVESGELNAELNDENKAAVSCCVQILLSPLQTVLEKSHERCN